MSFSISEWLLSVAAAFGGGLILNLMPCVFPILAVKAFSVVRLQEENPREVRLSGLAYTVGVVLSFQLLLGILFLLRHFGHQAGWGFQLQEPGFVALLLVVFFVMTLSLADLLKFDLPVHLLPLHLTSKSGLGGDFFSGLLAVFIASPCTAPLMAPALGFALSQSYLVAASIFLSLAIGFAGPFFALSFEPRLAKLLPKSGSWTRTFRELMIFPLLATQIWLLWLFSRTAGLEAASWLLGAVLGLGFLVWVFSRSRGKKWGRLLGVAAGVLLIAFSLNQMRQKPELAWQKYTEENIASLRSQNKIIFVDFTADWCLTCKANEKTVFGSSKVLQFLQDKQDEVVLVRADWTSEDEVITRALEKMGRAGVPLYLVYSPGKSEPEVLPQILTPDLVLEKLGASKGLKVEGL